ncbi:hypothetical protein B0H17DRAFT_1132786 [Mycena rosella]|uniref:Uncharacterized protein n=1 Tax=Mycena rosella TaxID=1033263 RepID=A0AAD7DJB9_MYCRO|nr:hypothetical protein B0H17DRAFT_1132786 [Mycena rosella]
MQFHALVSLAVVCFAAVSTAAPATFTVTIDGDQEKLHTSQHQSSVVEGTLQAFCNGPGSPFSRTVTHVAARAFRPANSTFASRFSLPDPESRLERGPSVLVHVLVLVHMNISLYTSSA